MVTLSAASTEVDGSQRKLLTGSQKIPEQGEKQQPQVDYTDAANQAACHYAAKCTLAT